MQSLASEENVLTCKQRDAGLGKSESCLSEEKTGDPEKNVIKKV